MIRLHLLGNFELQAETGEAIRLPTRKAEYVLAYLWCHRNQPHPRKLLAGVFWPETDESKARHNLSQAFSGLRKALEPNDGQKEQYLLLTRTAAQFNPQASCWVDVTEFEQTIEDVKTPDSRSLSEALALYRGDFLEGCYDDWCLEQRDYFQGLYLKGLRQLASEAMAQQDYEQAINTLKRMLTIRTWEEDAHHQLMEAYYLTGFRNLALKQYESCQQMLQDELGVEPETNTKALYERIKANPKPQGASLAKPVQPSTSIETREADLQHSVAVLPFSDLSPDGNHEYFSDGLSEELINALTKLDQLRVISRTSSFAFKGQNKPLRRIGEQLKVDTVLEGSVRTAGKHLRITAQLSSVRQDATLWSQTYDRKLDDVFAIQEEITHAIVSTLKVKLLGITRGPLLDQITNDHQAHHLYLKGRYFWNQRSEDELHKAIACFEDAIGQDANYARAYTGLADAYNVIGYYNYLPRQEAFAKAERFATKAVELDGGLAEAHASLALVKDYIWEWEAAKSAYRRAIELNPGLSTVRHWYALFLMNMDNLAQARVQMQAAQELDPLSLVVNRDLGHLLYHARDYDQALIQLRDTIDMNPEFPLAHLYLGLVYLSQGLYEQALTEFEVERGLSQDRAAETLVAYAQAKLGNEKHARTFLEGVENPTKNGHVPPYLVALVWFSLGKMDKGFLWLERAYETSDFWFSRLKADPLLDECRNDPHYAQLLEKMDFVSA